MAAMKMCLCKNVLVFQLLLSFTTNSTEQHNRTMLQVSKSKTNKHTSAFVSTSATNEQEMDACFHHSARRLA